jgi:hypothetical protein
MFCIDFYQFIQRFYFKKNIGSIPIKLKIKFKQYIEKMIQKPSTKLDIEKTKEFLKKF